MKIEKLFEKEVIVEDNLIVLSSDSKFSNQKQTNDVFSDKWTTVDKNDGTSSLDEFQKNWYLKLYGFNDNSNLRSFIKKQKTILDAGCGLGYKAAWFAEYSPESIVIGMDFSDSVYIAAKKYKNIKNLFFVKGDIAATHLKENSIDYVNCDQVIHHTEYPEKTFEHLCKITKMDGEFACYVYAKKALPRELVDDYFRDFSKKTSKDELWEMSESLTQLGKTLSELKLQIDVPDIPLLGIKGGSYDIQRFIYWNFIKCFWNDELGHKNSVATNFDWYAPSNAKRYSEKEFKDLINDNNLSIEYFNAEEACYSGRFKKNSICAE